jgi:penicillin-binding protein 1B
VLAVLLVMGLAGTAWLDALVRERFESHQWKLPARVFARPVELYQGRELTREHFRRLLSLMRYREAPGASTPGSYAFSSRRLLLHTRGFQGLDGEEPARQLRLLIDDGRIRELSRGNGDPVSLARLEPLQIGSIHPGHREDRVLLPLDEVPGPLVKMLLAVEDRAFYEHHGLSLRGLARAMVANIRAGGIAEGGSTLTQQLVKNFWLTNERSILRKLIEMPMALLLELHYDKDAILEAYINEVYLGQDGSRAIHGMGLGAQFYFGQPLSELQPHQHALLVALLKGPSYYDPRRNPQRALERRNTVLQVAHEQGLIGKGELVDYRQRGLEVVPRGESALYAFPAFVDLVRRQLARDYPPEVLSREGLNIQSTLDVMAQIAAEDALTEFFREGRPEPLNGAVVMTAPEQGDVLALVGNKAPRTAGFNRALDAVRPIGSLVKPAVVLTALEQPERYHLGTIVEDEAVSLTLPNGDVWEPQNYDRTSQGRIPMLQALVQSRNQAVARLGLELGLDSVVDTLQRLGVRREIRPYPSVLLGSLELSPFEVAVVYQTLAAEGFYTPLRSITDVLDRDGKPLARYPVATEQVVDAGPAWLIQWALQQVVARGTAQYAGERLPALHLAGKTGTSDAFRDSWFAGFSGSRLTVVWLGRDDNETTAFTGSSGALRVWTELMTRTPQRPLMLTPPAAVREVWLDRESGALSGPGCGNVARYPLLEVSMPEETTACGKAGQVKRGVMKWFKGLFD